MGKHLSVWKGLPVTNSLPLLVRASAMNSKSLIKLTPCENFVKLFSSSLTDEPQCLNLTSLFIAAKICRWGPEPPTLRVERLGFGLAFSLVQHIIRPAVKNATDKRSSFYRSLRVEHLGFSLLFPCSTYQNSRKNATDKHSSLFRRTVSGQFGKFYDADTLANSLPPSVTVSSWN